MLVGPDIIVSSTLEGLAHQKKIIQRPSICSRNITDIDDPMQHSYRASPNNMLVWLGRGLASCFFPRSSTSIISRVERGWYHPDDTEIWQWSEVWNGEASQRNYMWKFLCLVQWKKDQKFALAAKQLRTVDQSARRFTGDTNINPSARAWASSSFRIRCEL